jgi:hypothetical protein
MSTATQPNMSEMFQSALEQFESALKNGVKIQEESIKFLTSWAKDPPMMQDWTQRTQSAVTEMMSAAPQRWEETMRMMNEQAKSAMDLLHKAFEVNQSTNLPEAQGRLGELWEMTLGVMRNNIHSLLKTQSQAMRRWEEMVGCTGNGSSEKK